LEYRLRLMGHTPEELSLLLPWSTVAATNPADPLPLSKQEQEAQLGNQGHREAAVELSPTAQIEPTEQATISDQRYRGRGNPRLLSPHGNRNCPSSSDELNATYTCGTMLSEQFGE
jgi:hypothetical protein